MTVRSFPLSRSILVLVLAIAFTLTAMPRQALAACGDGVLDAGEQCDDNNGADGDCCSAACTYESFASPCADDGEFCTRDVCDGAGVCIHDGTPLDSCLVAPKGKLKFLNDGDDTKDKLTLQMQNAPGVTPDDFGSPTTSDAYHACIFGPDGLLMHAEIAPGGSCDGKPCWVETTTGFTYKDTRGTRDGITAMQLKASAKPKTKISAKGRGAALDEPALPFPDHVMAQVVNAETGQCFETYFLESTAVKTNSTEGYEAKSAAPGFEIPGIATVIRQDDLDLATPVVTEPQALLPGLDPTKVYIESITYEGSGCPPASVAQSFSSDRTSFTLIYDQFVASKGGGVPAAEAIKQCQLNLDLKLPQGWQYTISTIDHRGYVQLPKKMKAIQRTTYYFEGDGEFASADSAFVGPTTRDYLLRDTVPFSTVVWSSCDKVRPLTITTELELRGGTESGQITSDSTDGKVGTVVGLHWKPCP